MYANSLLALSGALLSVVAAVPMADQHRHQHHHHARDYVWVTHTQEEIVTVPVTKTVWMEPGETPPVEQPQGYSSSPDVEPAATSAPAAPAYTPESSSPAPAPYSSSESTPEAPAYTPPTSTSTSVYVAPTPTTPTSTYVAPTTPTSTYVAPTTYAAPSSSSAAPAAYSAPSSSGSESGSTSGLSYGMGKSGTSYSGDFTYYAVGLGACGVTSLESDKMVAISEKIFDSYDNGNPNNNPLCGKYITIVGKDGTDYQARIWDRCPGCDESSLDLPQEFFNTVTNNGDGRVHNMKWSFD